MKFINKTMFFFTSILIISTIIILFKTNLSLYWIETSSESAKVTINFLIPMVEDEIENHINWIYTSSKTVDISYSIKWINPNSVCIEAKETNLINGQDITLVIKDTPSKINGVFKSSNIKVSFRSEISILSPLNNSVISSNNGFEVTFNTPIDKQSLYKHLDVSQEFYIEPITSEDTTDHHNMIDFSKFKFTPKKPLTNNKHYILRFKKGLKSINGELLKQDICIVIKVDSKPCIVESYPKNNSKWIGIFPRFVIKSKTPIVAASMLIEDIKVNGNISKDNLSASFILPKLLDPDTTYKPCFKIKSLSGEVSAPYNINFTTTPINDNRIWLQLINNDNNSYIQCYKGKELIKTFPCSIGIKGYIPYYGTYYIQNKSDIYISEDNKENANYCLQINGQYYLHGYPRDEFWNIKEDLTRIKNSNSNHNNVIMADSDIEWLYHNIPNDTMIILKNSLN